MNFLPILSSVVASSIMFLGGCSSTTVIDASGGSASGDGAGGSGAEVTGGAGGANEGGASSQGGAGGASVNCPAELPIDGSNCEEAKTCLYDLYEGYTCTDGISVAARCEPVDALHMWRIDIPQCNGDPADCGDITHPTLCAADSSCRWLVPGCGDGVEIEAGCYPNFDCMPGGCGMGESCTTVSYDPCHVFCEGCDTCDACGAETDLCL